MRRLTRAVWRFAMAVRTAKELTVYMKAYKLAMEIHQVSKRFPPEERYAMTGQVRRSSRSVCLNLREAWAKRRYEAHFLSKLTDRDGENSETDSCLNFALDCGYLTTAEHQELTALNTEVGKLLGAMLVRPEKWLLSHSCPVLRPLTSDI